VTLSPFVITFPNAGHDRRPPLTPACPTGSPVRMWSRWAAGQFGDAKIELIAGEIFGGPEEGFVHDDGVHALQK